MLWNCWLANYGKHAWSVHPRLLTFSASVHFFAAFLHCLSWKLGFNILRHSKFINIFLIVFGHGQASTAFCWRYFKLGSIYYLHRSLRKKDVELLIKMLLLLLPEARFLYELMRIPWRFSGCNNCHFIWERE